MEVYEIDLLNGQDPGQGIHSSGAITAASNGIVYCGYEGFSSREHGMHATSIVGNAPWLQFPMFSGSMVPSRIFPSARTLSCPAGMAAVVRDGAIRFYKLGKNFTQRRPFFNLHMSQGHGSQYVHEESIQPAAVIWLPVQQVLWDALYEESAATHKIVENTAPLSCVLINPSGMLHRVIHPHDKPKVVDVASLWSGWCASEVVVHLSTSRSSARRVEAYVAARKGRIVQLFCVSINVHSHPSQMFTIAKRGKFTLNTDPEWPASGPAAGMTFLDSTHMAIKIYCQGGYRLELWSVEQDTLPDLRGYTVCHWKCKEDISLGKTKHNPALLRITDRHLVCFVEGEPMNIIISPSGIEVIQGSTDGFYFASPAGQGCGAVAACMSPSGLLAYTLTTRGTIKCFSVVPLLLNAKRLHSLSLDEANKFVCRFAETCVEMETKCDFVPPFEVQAAFTALCSHPSPRLQDCGVAPQNRLLQLASIAETTAKQKYMEVSKNRESANAYLFEFFESDHKITELIKHNHMSMLLDDSRVECVHLKALFELLAAIQNAKAFLQFEHSSSMSNQPTSLKLAQIIRLVAISAFSRGVAENFWSPEGSFYGSNGQAPNVLLAAPYKHLFSLMYNVSLFLAKDAAFTMMKRGNGYRKCFQEFQESSHAVRDIFDYLSRFFKDSLSRGFENAESLISNIATRVVEPIVQNNKANRNAQKLTILKFNAGIVLQPEQSAANLIKWLKLNSNCGSSTFVPPSLINVPNTLNKYISIIDSQTLHFKNTKSISSSFVCIGCFDVTYMSHLKLATNVLVMGCPRVGCKHTPWIPLESLCRPQFVGAGQADKHMEQTVENDGNSDHPELGKVEENGQPESSSAEESRQPEAGSKRRRSPDA